MSTSDSALPSVSLPCPPKLIHARGICTGRIVGDLKEQIRGGFELHRGVKDLYAVKYHLSDGRVQLKMLQEMMAMKL